MKKCLKCNKIKEPTEFGKDKQKKTGLNTYCKACIRIRSKNQKIENKEYFERYGRKYREKNKEILRQKAKCDYEKNREKRLEQGKKSYYKNREEISKRRKIKRITDDGRRIERERQKIWRLKNQEKYRSYIRKWQCEYRYKNNAHAKVHRAVKSGNLIRSETCEVCGKICKTEGHHEDYSKPLEVIWLCRTCHAQKIEKVKV